MCQSVAPGVRRKSRPPVSPRRVLPLPASQPWVWVPESWSYSLRGLQFYVRGHSGENAVRWIVDANLYAKNLVDPFFPRLHVARQKLCLLIDLLDGALENRLRERIDPHFCLLAQSHMSNLGFRDVNPHVDLVTFQQGRDRRVRRNQISRTHIQNFDGRRRRRHDFSFAIPRLIVRIRSLRQIDVFPPVAPLKLVKRRFRLVITRLSRGDFLGPVAMMELIQLVLGILLLRQRNAPGSLRRIALLL